MGGLKYKISKAVDFKFNRLPATVVYIRHHENQRYVDLFEDIAEPSLIVKFIMSWILFPGLNVYVV